MLHIIFFTVWAVQKVPMLFVDLLCHGDRGNFALQKGLFLSTEQQLFHLFLTELIGIN